jgi:hypothetical protein
MAEAPGCTAMRVQSASLPSASSSTYSAATVYHVLEDPAFQRCMPDRLVALVLSYADCIGPLLITSPSLLSRYERLVFTDLDLVTRACHMLRRGDENTHPDSFTLSVLITTGIIRHCHRVKQASIIERFAIALAQSRHALPCLNFLVSTQRYAPSAACMRRCLVHLSGHLTIPDLQENAEKLFNWLWTGYGQQMEEGLRQLECEGHDLSRAFWDFAGLRLSSAFRCEPVPECDDSAYSAYDQGRQHGIPIRWRQREPRRCTDDSHGE